MFSRTRRLTLLAAALLCAGAAHAQPLPNKPIRAVVPFAAGSATDQIGRAFADPGQHVFLVKYTRWIGR